VRLMTEQVPTSAARGAADDATDRGQPDDSAVGERRANGTTSVSILTTKRSESNQRCVRRLSSRARCACCAAVGKEEGEFVHGHARRRIWAHPPHLPPSGQGHAVAQARHRGAEITAGGHRWAQRGPRAWHIDPSDPERAERLRGSASGLPSPSGSFLRAKTSGRCSGDSTSCSTS
jgi:hypothetical protein